jgi:hypothetical protein
MKTLEQYRPEDIAAKATELRSVLGEARGLDAYFDWLTGLREECFERRAAEFRSPELDAWIVQLTTEARFRAGWSGKFRVHRSTLSPVAAFLATRYGEDPAHWPDPADGLSDEDRDRLREWVYGIGKGTGVAEPIIIPAEER